MTATRIASSPRPQPLGWPTAGSIVALAYFIIVGGSFIAEVDPVLRTVNVTLAGALLLRYLLRMPRFGDRIDRTILCAVILFAFAGVLSSALRQSLDAVLQAATYAAAFFTARELLAREAVRVMFIRLLMCLSALLTFIAAARWFPIVLAWWSATDRTLLPPLDLGLSGLPWGHRYDLALLIAMLYPAWWVGASSALRRSAAIVVGAVVGLIVLIVGSRTLWAALAVASVVVAAPRLASAWRSPRLRTMVVIAAFGVLLILVSGVVGAVLQRGTSGTSLGWRTAMWGPLVEVWIAHPLAGYGPASFPWILQQTTYFNTNTWAPLHPDSVPFQLVGEAGLLGVLALVVILTALLPPILRGRSIAARWALLAFAVACVGANPTVFVDLMSLAIAWAAYSLPREVHQGKSVDGRAGPARVASYAAAAIVGAAYVAMLIAGFTYEGARMAVENGDLTEARSALDLSVTLDPSMALYWRQRGELSYVAKLPSAAAADLRRAAELNPSDDLAWRALALASAAAGDGDEAGLALAEALKVQRSDVTNLLTRAQWLVRHDRVPEARELLAEVVQSWPSIVAAPGWNELLPPSVSTAQIIDQATRRWELGLNTPEIASDQGLWLAVLGNRPDIDQRAVDEATMGPTLAKSELALLRCQSPGSLLNQATDAERRTLSYWTLRIRVASLDRHQDEAANQIYGIMVGDPGFLDRGDDMLNPLNDAPVMDLWGYRRWPIRWPEVGAALPSPDSGWVTWLLHPREAVRTAGLADRLPACN